MCDEVVFTFHNMRSAMQAETALQLSGMTVRVMSRPAAFGAGCGMCLRVDLDEYVRAEQVFQEKEVVVDGVYRKKREDGKTVYMPL